MLENKLGIKNSAGKASFLLGKLVVYKVFW